MTSIKWLRLAVFLIFVGVIFELIAVIDLNPTTFLGFVIIGIPSLVLGMLIYVVHVLRQLRKTGAL